MTDYIAWLDLETDGAADYRDGHILEIGVVVTDNKLNIKKSFHRVIHASERALKRMPEVVRDMHHESGLWDEVLSSTDDIYTADFYLADILAKYDQVALAGSGVLHYDKKWVNFWMPRSSRYLTYWGYDVGVIRRTLALAGVPPLEKTKGIVGVEHRALDDALSAMLEMRRYIDKFEALKDQNVG